MDIISEDNADITNVRLQGVRPTDNEVEFILGIDPDGGDSPIIKILVYKLVYKNEAGQKSVLIEMDDCLPRYAIPLKAVTVDLILYLKESHNSNEVLGIILASLLAPIAKLKVKGTREGIRFELTIGKFVTQARIDHLTLKHHLVPA